MGKDGDVPNGGQLFVYKLALCVVVQYRLCSSISWQRVESVIDLHFLLV